ncbi:MAG: cation transporter [Clostridia bacterium]|nr:heavy-metal-associated domain-containing protein [Oscillospiraceae bacterium]MBQ2773669.1 cation transporter [Clostridia bacterium]MBQ3056756.1 cation transporter [Clostridia bacterium]
MKKVFELIDLDCAHCAARMEEGIRKLAGVNDVSVNFLTQKLMLEADDAVFDKVLKQAVKICRKIEPDCTVVIK